MGGRQRNLYSDVNDSTIPSLNWSAREVVVSANFGSELSTSPSCGSHVDRSLVITPSCDSFPMAVKGFEFIYCFIPIENVRSASNSSRSSVCAMEEETSQMSLLALVFVSWALFRLELVIQPKHRNELSGGSITAFPLPLLVQSYRHFVRKNDYIVLE